MGLMNAGFRAENASLRWGCFPSVAGQGTATVEMVAATGLARLRRQMSAKCFALEFQSGSHSLCWERLKVYRR